LEQASPLSKVFNLPLSKSQNLGYLFLIAIFAVKKILLTMLAAGLLVQKGE